MTQENDLQILEIAVSDFDLSLLPTDARKPGSEEFKAAITHFYDEQLVSCPVNTFT